MEAKTPQLTSNSSDLINTILGQIDKEREKEIISRRFGLFDRKETLEQIGEMLGITRERVRQLEKTILLKVRAIAGTKKITDFTNFETEIISNLSSNGGLLNISQLTETVVGNKDKIEQSRMTFIALLSDKLVVLNENDLYFTSVALKDEFSEKNLMTSIDKLVKTIADSGEPCNIKQLVSLTGNSNEKQLSSLANCSKLLASLNDHWGLIKWPTVNPKNIRDKIYVILKENGKQMHFNEISDSIKKSDFKRKDVTTQAIHNELIKDKRFVLVGRGIYALKEWGFSKGTVSDVISKILKEAKKPLHKDDIVKSVLKDRFVKETTILLNLQNKSKFKRVAKATYDINEK